MASGDSFDNFEQKRPYSNRHKRRKVKQRCDAIANYFTNNLGNLDVSNSPSTSSAAEPHSFSLGPRHLNVEELNEFDQDNVAEPNVQTVNQDEDSSFEDDDFRSCISENDFLEFQHDPTVDFEDSDYSPIQSDDDSSDNDPSDPGSSDEAPESSDEEDSGSRSSFRSLLAGWASSNRICHSSIEKLLAICRMQPWGNSLPKSARTLLKTPRSVTVKRLTMGEYHHFGILSGITRVLNNIPLNKIPNNIEMFVNIDGLPIAKSSGSQFWPILGEIRGIGCRKPFLIGLYHGNSKPLEPNEYLEDFLADVHELRANGFEFKGKLFHFRGVAFICDAPAKAYIKFVKSHTAYFACNHCTTEGDYVAHRVVYPQLDAALRTNESFRNKDQEEHHTGESVLEQLDIDMVQDFPCDPMHLLYLGINRKILLNLMKGPLNVRLRRLNFEQICSNMESFRDHIPSEYARKTRSLKLIDRFKATEHGMFCSFVGPVALAQQVSTRVYNNFLVFHVVVRILSSNEYCRILNDYAYQLLKMFIEECESLYGAQFISYNVHCAIHLPADVLRFGSLPNFTAYSFENYLQTLKKMLRKHDRPLQQIVKRVTEYENCVFQELKKETGNKGKKFTSEHGGGPLPRFLRRSVRQFKKLELGSFALTCKSPNNCIYLHEEGKAALIIFIDNIIKTEGSDLFVGRRFTRLSDLYSYPISSSRFDIYTASALSSNYEVWPISMFKYKAVKLPLPSADGVFAIFPLLVEEHN